MESGFHCTDTGNKVVHAGSWRGLFWCLENALYNYRSEESNESFGSQCCIYGGPKHDDQVFAGASSGFCRVSTHRILSQLCLPICLFQPPRLIVTVLDGLDIQKLHTLLLGHLRLICLRGFFYCKKVVMHEMVK